MRSSTSRTRGWRSSEPTSIRLNSDTTQEQQDSTSDDEEDLPSLLSESESDSESDEEIYDDLPDLTKLSKRSDYGIGTESSHRKPLGCASTPSKRLTAPLERSATPLERASRMVCHCWSTMNSMMTLNTYDHTKLRSLWGCHRTAPQELE